MTTPTFGPPIPCEGKRPTFVADSDCILFREGDGGYGQYVAGALPVEMWEGIVEVSLPADHWAYEPISRGFEPWAGAEEAPEDWDGGEVLWDNPKGYKKSDLKLPHQTWLHDQAGWYNIIGYRKRLAKPASPAEESGEAAWNGVELDLAVIDKLCEHAKAAGVTPGEWAAARLNDAAFNYSLEVHQDGRPATHAVIRKISEKEAWDIWKSFRGDGRHASFSEALMAMFRHLDLIAPPESPLDRFCRERGVTDEQRAVIEEWEASK